MMSAFDRAWAVVKTPEVEMQVNFLLNHPDINYSLGTILQEAQTHHPDSMAGILRMVAMSSPSTAQQMVKLLMRQFGSDEVPSSEPDHDPDFDDMMEAPRELRGME